MVTAAKHNIGWPFQCNRKTALLLQQHVGLQTLENDIQILIQSSPIEKELYIYGHHYFTEFMTHISTGLTQKDAKAHALWTQN